MQITSIENTIEIIQQKKIKRIGLYFHCEQS